jgi:hypothetical protein
MAPKARTCTICNAPIPDTASHNATTCGDDNCKRERSRRASAAYRARHPGRHNENVARHRAKLRPGEEKARRHCLTYERYTELLAASGGACTICGSDRNLRIDHDHRCCPGPDSCGECVRAIVCHSCNIAVGLFGDSPDRLAAAIRYLLGERGARLVDGGIDALRGWLT